MNTYVLPLTSKGTFTIPKAVRASLGLVSSRKVVLVYNEKKKQAQLVALPKSIEELSASLPRRTSSVPSEQMQSVVQEERAEHYLSQQQPNSR